MLHDRRPNMPVVGERDKLEEMDVHLSPREFREFFSHSDRAHVDRLLSGAYLLEPWVRVRMGEKWVLTAGVEATRTTDDGA